MSFYITFLPIVVPDQIILQIVVPDHFLQIVVPDQIVLQVFVLVHFLQIVQRNAKKINPKLCYGSQSSFLEIYVVYCSLLHILISDDASAFAPPSPPLPCTTWLKLVTFPFPFLTVGKCARENRRDDGYLGKDGLSAVWP